MKSLLDTQIIIWSFNEPERIKSELKLFIDDERNSLFISVLSFFEIEQKRRSGKLKFDYDFKWLVEGGYFQVLDLRIDHIYKTKDLPLIHRDPFDRLLIAQSIVEGIPLITSDKQIQQYDFPHVKA